MVGPVLYAERQAVIAAIDGGGRGIDKMPHPPLTREFQHVDMPRQVGAHIGVRIDQRIAHAGLRAEMDDRFDHLIGKRCLQRIIVGEIQLVKGEQLAMRLFQRGNPVPLQRHGIIIVHIIDADHGMALRHEPIGDGHADKAGRAGDQYRHALHSPTRSRASGRRTLSVTPKWRAK